MYIHLPAGLVNNGQLIRQLTNSQENTQTRVYILGDRRVIWNNGSSIRLPDVLPMLVHRYEVLFVRIGRYFACFLALGLIVSSVRPHRDQLQVHCFDLLLLPSICGKTGNRLITLPASVSHEGVTGLRFLAASHASFLA